ncbi:MAG: peptidylprolyl isomerase [Spirochaetes bacterium]|jgi:peptidylprolyl isomerase|nr:peptidylprolyl isomerase [Spirochaetota bacterium]
MPHSAVQYGAATGRRRHYGAGAFARALIILVFILVGVAAFAGGTKEKYPDLERGLYAELTTEKGSILIDLKYELVPLTVANFVGLAEGTIAHSEGEGPFYDGLTFHRVEKDFVVQGGDPAGDGTGGPGYRIPTETHQSLTHSEAGIVAMANSGPNRNGSQFYITLRATPWLDGNYSIFGEVVRGMEAVNEIEKGDVIQSIDIVRKGNEAKEFATDQESFDELLAEKQAEVEKGREAALTSQEAYIERNWPDARRMDNGIRYVIEEEGSGPKPAANDTVAVHYTGSLLTGMPFETTENQNEPAVFDLGQVRTIPGWEATLRDMRPGEKRTAIIPPDLGFGDRGRQGLIPPNSYLVFEVELVEINP